MLRWTVIAVCVFATSGAWGDDESACHELKNAGATIVRDESQPGAPIRLVKYPLRLVTLQGLRALKEIEVLPAIEFIGSGGTEITPATLRALQGKPALKRLSISLARIGDDSARILPTLKSLEAVDLRSQVESSPVGLQELFRMHHLQELSLSDRLVTDEVLQDLAKLPNLRVLNLRSLFVTDAGLASLRRLHGLQSLRITLTENVTQAGRNQLAEMKLRYLEITSFNATDREIKDLGRLMSLRKLRLINAVNVTGAAIPCFAEMTNLKELEVLGATFSTSDVKRLKTDLPNCQVTLGRQ